MDNEYYVKYLKYKSKYINNKNLHGGKTCFNIDLINIKKEELTPPIKTKIYNLYISTYTASHQKIWFETEDKLFNVYSGYMIKYDEGGEILYGFAYHKLKFAKKISLRFYNEKEEYKIAISDIIAKLLITPGYILESSGASAHVFKKYYRLMPHTDIESIKKLLDKDISLYYNSEEELIAEVASNPSIDIILPKINSTIIKLDDQTSIDKFPSILKNEEYLKNKGNSDKQNFYIRLSGYNTDTKFPYINIENLFGLPCSIGISFKGDLRIYDDDICCIK
jgi:hypothetical protein